MKLFYSYSHQDEAQRKEIEKYLAPLRTKGLIEEWHDRRLTPGQSLTPEIEEQMTNADMIAFLLSPNFLASAACKDELERGLSLRASQGTTLLPIVLTTCPWDDDPRLSAILGLPTDGKALDRWSDRNAGLQSIYEGVKLAVQSRDLSIRPPFLETIKQTGFISQNRSDISLDDIFVFPHIIRIRSTNETRIDSLDDIWKTDRRVLVRGSERSGKTSLCVHLFIESADVGSPTLFLQGTEIRSARRHGETIRNAFDRQFGGSFDDWFRRDNKVLVVDGITNTTPLGFLDYADEIFSNIFVTVSEDHHLAYFHDEPRFTRYGLYDIRPLRHVQQERLIRKWIDLDVTSPTNHNVVDRLEDLVNSVVIDKRVVPRYPFYVLSILQASEISPNRNAEITAYGHCYQALITAQITRSGVDGDAIDSAFNFLTYLAFDMFRFGSRGNYGTSSYQDFYRRYLDEFVISDSVVNRLMAERTMFQVSDNQTLTFRYPFVYYFFLGRYFAINQDRLGNEIERIADRSYLRENTYILIFAIHHARDNDLIDTVLIHTMESLSGVETATLTRDEMSVLESVVDQIPKTIASKSVEDSRKELRDQMDEAEEASEEDYTTDDVDEYRNEFFRLFKNMEILGQIVRNKFGSFTKSRLREIIETATEAGLRVIGELTKEDVVEGVEDYLVELFKKDGDFQKIGKNWEEDVRRAARMLFFWAICGSLSKTVSTISKPELDDIVHDVCSTVGTPAYQLIDFLFGLTTAASLSERHVEDLTRLNRGLSESGGVVASRVLSLATQQFLTTHDVDYRLRQKAYQVLEIPYRHYDPSRR